MGKIVKMHKKAKYNLNILSWVVRFNTIKVSVLSKMTYTLDSIQFQVKLQKGCSINLDEVI